MIKVVLICALIGVIWTAVEEIEKKIRNNH